MSVDISLTTIGLSAGISVVTSYVGTLINSERQRNRSRRVFGLALLAEIKSLRRSFRHHYGLVNGQSTPRTIRRLPTTRFGMADMTVFSNGSGNLGLFSTRTAVEVIEFYSTVRTLIGQVQALSNMEQERDSDPADLSAALDDHVCTLGLARHQCNLAVDALRRDIPLTVPETIRYGVRRILIVKRKTLRRLFKRSRCKPPIPAASLSGEVDA